DHGDAVRGVEDHAEPGPDQLLVVGDQHPDRPGRLRGGHGGGHRAGSRAVTANPPSGPGPADRFPPQDATRSAMPASPNPARAAAPSRAATGRTPATASSRAKAADGAAEAGDGAGAGAAWSSGTRDRFGGRGWARSGRER